VTNDVDFKFTKWAVDDTPSGLSVNADSNLIVTSNVANTIRLFTTDGKPVNAINLQPSGVVHPWHTIQLAPNKYVVCHGAVTGGVSDPQHRVCIVDETGKVLQSFGDLPGSGENQLKVPVRLAVVNGFIFVDDLYNRRLIMLSRKLRYIRAVLSGLSNWPLRIWFDEQNDRLYLLESKYENKEWSPVHIGIYSVGS
jgi:hypothetical protein